MRRVDITGQKFSKLTAIKKLDGFTRSTWLCRCECGGEANVRMTNLKSGNTKSCGCIVPDVAGGFAGTPEYTAFYNARNRCERKADPRYANYGGRGIQFRLKSVKELIDAIGRRPSCDHSLDRIDNDGHYEVSNIRWANIATQKLNKKTTLRVPYKGKEVPLWSLCVKLNQPYKRVWERLNAGWSVEEALTRPPKAQSKRVTA